MRKQKWGKDDWKQWKQEQKQGKWGGWKKQERQRGDFRPAAEREKDWPSDSRHFDKSRQSGQRNEILEKVKSIEKEMGRDDGEADSDIPVWRWTQGGPNAEKDAGVPERPPLGESEEKLAKRRKRFGLEADLIKDWSEATASTEWRKNISELKGDGDVSKACENMESDVGKEETENQTEHVTKTCVLKGNGKSPLAENLRERLDSSLDACVEHYRAVDPNWKRL